MTKTLLPEWSKGDVNYRLSTGVKQMSVSRESRGSNPL